MKLIDADNFIGFMAALEEAGADDVSFDSLRKFIERQPAAYDVEKVVGQLEEMKNNAVDNILLNSQSDDLESEIESEKKHYDNIIGCVKEGGVHG